MRLKIELLDTPINLAIGHAQRHCFVIQPVGFFVALRCISLLHHVSSLLCVVFLVGLHLLELLANGIQILRLLVVPLIAMTPVAATLAEEKPAIINVASNISDGGNHVGCVTGLASRFDILLGKQRPEPMLVVSVSLLYASRGAAIALMTWRATELIRIMNFQQLRLRMTYKRLRILIRLLLTLRSH